MSEVTLQELRDNFTATDRRKLLLSHLEEEISDWTSTNLEFRCWLFGSFLTESPEPGDIDVLLSVLIKPPQPPFLPRRHKETIQVLKNFGFPQKKSKAEMIQAFNEQESNKAARINISNERVVELILD